MRRRRLAIPTRFERGLRVTDDATMEVVEMVLGGKINREIVELIQQAGGQGVGFTGSDGGLLRVKRKLINGQDLGRVGDPTEVDPTVIRAAMDAGFVPVIAPIGVGVDPVPIATSVVIHSSLSR